MDVVGGIFSIFGFVRVGNEVAPNRLLENEMKLKNHTRTLYQYRDRRCSVTTAGDLHILVLRIIIIYYVFAARGTA